MSTNTSTLTPYEQYLYNIQNGIRSSASKFAYDQDRTKYWQGKHGTRYLETATSATQELKSVVLRTKECTDERDMYKVLVAQLSRDIYGLQAYTTYLAAVTGEKYTPEMNDPQEVESDLLTSGGAAVNSLNASLAFLKEHIVSTRLVLATNRRAMGYVESLVAALTPDENLDVVIRQVVGNDYKESVSDLVTKFAAVADSE